MLVSVRHQITICLLGFLQAIPLIFLVAPLQVYMLHQGLGQQVGWSSLVLLPYSFKFIWSLWIDKLKSIGVEFNLMIALCTLMIGICFSAMGILDPKTSLGLMTLSLFIAFMSSTLDDVIDGYRSHIFNESQQSYMISLNVISYRIGMFTGAAIIWLASQFSWQVAFQIVGPTFTILSLLCASLLPTKTANLEVTNIDWLAPFRKICYPSIMPLMRIFLYRCADFWIYGLLTVYLIQYHNWTAVSVAQTLQGIGVVSVITGNLLAHFIIKKIGLDRAMKAFLASQAFAVVVMASTLILKSYYWIVICISLQELVFGFTSLTLSLLCYQSLDKKYPTYCFATYTSLATAPRFLMSPISAYIVKSSQWDTFFIIGFVISLLANLIFMRLTTPNISTKVFKVVEDTYN